MEIISKKITLAASLLLMISLVYGGTDPFGSFLSDDPYAEEIIVSAVDTTPIENTYTNSLFHTRTNPFDLNDPAAVEKEIEYDPITGNYIITERIGNEYYRYPTEMTFQEFLEFQSQKQDQAYFNSLAGVSSPGNRNDEGILDPVAQIDISENLIDRLFGGNDVQIEPQGNVDLTFGWDYQEIENPILLERQRKQSGFDFDMDIAMNVSGKIGDKLDLGTNFNSAANFDFENKLKLEYDSEQFNEDEILKKIEAGNVSLPLRSNLIQGSQNLFGLKLETQWGRLRLTGLAALANSENESIQIQGGSLRQEFQIYADQYDENRHFFLSHFNRNTFEASLNNLPQIESLFRINRVEVWVTNDRSQQTTDIRDIVALSDLGEYDRMTNEDPDRWRDGATNKYLDVCRENLVPTNEVNGILDALIANPENREIDKAVESLTGMDFDFENSRDFEKVRARRLSPSEYTLNNDLGYISININLRPDQVLGIAYEYTYNGRDFRVGELSETQPANYEDPGVLFVKLLKSTTQRVDLPTWDLMMKNVYSLGAFNVDQSEFLLDVFYEDPGEGYKRFLPDETGLASEPLLALFNLDTLNVTGDPQPDGRFDFVEGLTINSRTGKVMFPVLEPFGSLLENRITDPAIADKYVYNQLYDSTIVIAREYPELNRFVIRGHHQSSSTSEISLGSFNIPPGSVRVRAGGQELREGIDYDVDYNIGKVRILNEAFLQSGQPISVSFEENALFSFQRKTMLGLRADYAWSKNLNFGGSFMHLFETPYTEKVNIGDDPINNRVLGLDLNYSKEAPGITKLVDAIPGIQTKAPSNIAFDAEVAAIKPGHSRFINQGSGDEKAGTVYIDDFEGTTSSIDLKAPINQWVISSLPQDAIRGQSDAPDFFEVNEFNTTESGVNRAKLAWYRPDRTARVASDNNSPYTQLIDFQEIFPNRSVRIGLNDVQTFDLHYIPTERGPYNFDPPEGTAFSSGLTSSGNLRDPKTRWAGIQRELTNTDFQRSNIEFVEMWVLDPFLTDELGGDGEVYLQLGNVSEDILRDSRLAFENGIPADPQNASTDTTNWSRIPILPSPINAFDNDPATRLIQDVGLDGFSNEGEKEQFKEYIEAVNSAGMDVDFVQSVQNDPAADDFVYYRDPQFTEDDGALVRYRNYNNPEGNSQPTDESVTPTVGGLGGLSSYTNLPDSEDINNDNTLNENESYFEYKIRLERNTNGIGMKPNPYVTDQITSVDGTRTWYRLRVPVNEPTRTVGGINDLRSIRFVRLFMTDFEQETVLRFARLELVRNQWRRYTRNVCGADGDATFEVDAVNFEEHSTRQPFSYVLPRGINRERVAGSLQEFFANEQSMSLKFCNLTENADDQCYMSMYKLLDMDMRVFERLRMFTHAELDQDNGQWEDGDVSVYIRLGSDYINNYYEYEIPLTTSKDPSSFETVEEEIWRDENDLDLVLSKFTNLKIERNALGASLADPYEKIDDDPETPGDRIIRVKGNPNLGLVRNIMIGIRNNSTNSVCGEIWVNELRLSGLEERGGIAAEARLDVGLADLGGLTLAGNYSTIGWGQLDQKLAARAKEEILQLDASINLELGKFAPNSGIRLPMYAQWSQFTSTPQFDPYDLDLNFKEKLRSLPTQAERETLKDQAIEKKTIKSINFTNVRKERSAKAQERNPDKKSMPWDLSNWSASYAFTETDAKDEILSQDNLKHHKGSLDYTYSRKGTYIQPLENVFGGNEWFKLISELNINPLPNSFSFSTGLDRKFSTKSYRFSQPQYETWFDKRFTWDRDYNVRWDLTKSIKINFNARNNAVLDEPAEYVDRNQGIRIDPEVRNDSIMTNFRNFGRNKFYTHGVSASYALPFGNFPLLDWVRADARYDADYSWTAASINTQSLGNVIQNGQTRSFNADLDFVKFYDKLGYLEKINKGKSSSSSSSKSRSRGGVDRQDNRSRSSSARDVKPDDAKTSKASRDPKAKEKGDRDPTIVERIIFRPLMTVRKLRLNYTENFGTVVPGFTPSTRLFGQDEGFLSPGWDFVAGWQPLIDPFNGGDWLENASNNSWITTDGFLNQPVLQNKTQTLSGKLTLEPFRDFRIEVTADRNVQENLSVFYKNIDSLYKFDPVNNIEFGHLTPREIGSFSMSYFSMQTLFERGDSLHVFNLFKAFEESRAAISQEVGVGEHAVDQDIYTEGFGEKQQDIIIPAFIATYTGQEPKFFNTNSLFNALPRPNWNLNYNGLTKIPWFKDRFSSFSLTHGYKSTLQINSFQSNLLYNFDQNTGQQNVGNLNPSTQNYYSRYVIPALVMSEQFAPLIGLDIKTKSDFDFNLTFRKSRSLQLGFISNELSETRSTEYVAGLGYTMKNVTLFTGSKSKKRSSSRRTTTKSRSGDPVDPTAGAQEAEGNDMTFTVDFAFRDDLTVNHYLDSDSQPQPTRGLRSITFSPAVDYQLNESLVLRAFLDYRKTEPKTTQSYPITSIQGGITVRFLLDGLK